MGSINIGFTSSTVAVGAVLQLHATDTTALHVTSDATSIATWSSSNPAIVSVNSSGLVTGVTTGYATIRAALGQDTGSAVITVTASGTGTGTGATALTLSPGNATVYLGGGQQYSATATSSNGTATNVSATWSVAPTSIATINSSGLLTAVAAGSFTVTGVSGGQTATTTGTVAAVALTGIAVTPATVTIAGGNTQQFLAIGTYNDGSSRDVTSSVTWASSNTTALTIDAKGLATVASTAAPGAVTVTASQGPITATASVQITSSAILTDLVIEPTSSSIAAGSAQQNKATAWYSDGTQMDVTKNVIWSSTSSSVTTVNASGVSTADAPGRTTLTATLGTTKAVRNANAKNAYAREASASPNAGGNTMQSSSDVIVTPATVTSLAIRATRDLFPVGSIQPVQLIGTFSDGTTQDLSVSANWKSSNSAVATIDQTGLATGVSAGNITLSATFGGLTASTIGFQVLPTNLVSLIVSVDHAILIVGTSQTPHVAGIYSDGTTHDLTQLATWQSTNPTALPVDSNGLTNALKPGNAQITATVAGLSGIVDVLVTDGKLVSISIQPFKPVFALATTQTLTAYATFDNHAVLDASADVVWRSEDPAVLTINGNGVAKAGKVGTTRVTASFLGITAESTDVQVTNATATFLRIIASTDLKPLNSGVAGVVDTRQVPVDIGLHYLASAVFSDGSFQDVTRDVIWNTSDNSVVSIDTTGFAIGMKPGKVQVTATIAGQSASLPLTVSDTTLASVYITPGGADLPVGQSNQYYLLGIFADGTRQDLTQEAVWLGSTPSIVYVEDDGFVLGTAPGVGEATAQYGYFRASTPVYVTNATLVSTALSVFPGSTLRVGENAFFHNSGTFSDGQVLDLVFGTNFVSGSPLVAQTLPTGQSYARSPGTSQITAIYNGTNLSATLTVLSGTITSIAITPANPSVSLGATQQFTVTATYDDGTTGTVAAANPSLTWTSSNPAVVSVDAAGFATASNAPGMAVVTATYSASQQGSVPAVSTNASTTVTVGPGGNPTALQVTPTSAHIAAGTTKQLIATATYADGTTRDISSLVTWTSTNPATATVNARGLVTSVRTGTVSIQAATGSLASSSIVVVSSATLVSLAISPSGASFSTGSTQQFVLTGTFSDGTTQDLSSMATWTTTNPAVATISSTGLATGVGTGSVQFTATYGGLSVTSATSNVTSSVLLSIALSPSTLNLAKGTTQQFTVIGTYSDGTTRNLTSSANYATSNSAVVSMSTTGLATATGTGNVQITATVGGQTASTQSVSVSPAVLSSISITPRDLTFAKGTTQQFTATGTFTDGTTQDLTRQAVWSSGTPQVITIDQNGLATAGAQGNAQVTATYTGVSATTNTLHVTPATVLNILLSPTSAQIAKGTTQQFTATGIFSDGTTQNITTTVTWSTSNGQVVSIDTNGIATGNGPGAAQISATYTGKTVSTSSFTVTPATLVSLTFNPANPTVASGTSTHVTVIGTYSDGTTQDLTSTAIFSSSNTAVATVSSGGIINGMLPGTATITVNAGGQTTSFPVTVSTAVLTSLVITPANPPAFAKGATFQFTATGTFSDGTTQNLSSSVTWISSNTAVFTIDQNGLATGVGVGSASLTATFQGQIATTSSFQVTPATVASISVTPQNLSLTAGGTQQYTATATYTDNTSANVTSTVTWSSSNTAAATISASGLMNAVAAGTSTITAQLAGKSGASTLTVNAGSGPVVPTLTSIAITPSVSSIARGNTQQFTATGTYSDGSQVDISNQVGWQSSVSAVATINNTGLATSIAGGNTQIRATLASQTAVATLTVSPATLTTLAVTPQTASVASGTTQQYRAVGTLSDGSTQDLTTSVTWTSSNSSLATINTNGLASTLGTGTVTITATAGNATNSATLTITTATVTGLQVTPSPVSLPAGGTQQLLVTATFSDGSSQNVTSAATYSTSNPSVVTVDSNGNLHAVGPGNAVVTTTLNGATTTLTVVIGNATVTSLAITPQNPTLAAGQSQQLTATATYSDGSTQNLSSSVTWSSSNTSVATVSSSGNVIVAQAGTTTITATTSGISATDTVTGTAAVATALSVSPASATLAAGQTQQFAATATMSDGTQQTVTTSVHWSVSDANKANISNTSGSNGLLTANAAGSLNAIASLNGVNGSAAVTITAATLSSLTINPSAVISLPAGTNQQLSVTGAYSDGSSANVTSQVTWSSSQASTAYVDNTALLHAVTSGITTINAALQGVTGTAAVTVGNATLTSITLTPANPVRALGQTVQMTATGRYSDNSTADITSQVQWNSGTPAVATISSTGLVTTLATGASNLTATLNGVAQSTPLTVTSATLQSISVQVANGSSSSFALGTSLQLRAIGTYSDGSTQNLTSSVTWSSSNPAVGVVSSSGLATGVTPGTFNARATSSGITGSTPITVTAATLVSIAVTPANQIIVNIQGSTVQFTATGTFSNGSTQNLTNSVHWTTTGIVVGSISQTGVFSPTGVGVGTVVATSGTITGSTQLTVVSLPLI